MPDRVLESPAEARLRALVDAIPDLMFRIHADGTYLDFAGDVSLLANPQHEVIGGNIDELLPKHVGTALMGCTRRALESGSLETVGYVLRTVAGEDREFEARVVPVDEQEVVVIVRDMTELKETERELRAAHERVVKARDEERRRIERNLHDGAQQRLVVALQSVRLAAKRIASDPDATVRLLATGEAELTAAITETRELARGLHPALLARHGLAPAVDQLMRRLDAFGEVTVDILDERLDHELETCAYYVIAEALANASKHAAATAVRVEVVRSADLLMIEVADDGSGGATRAEGGGLQGLADRVAAHAGRLELDSPPGSGTRLRAEIPLPRGN